MWGRQQAITPRPRSRASERVGCRLLRFCVGRHQHARKVRLLLLGRGVVSAHRIERPFAGRLDERRAAGSQRERARGGPWQSTERDSDAVALAFASMRQRLCSSLLR
jgi:hypothetical protein